MHHIIIDVKWILILFHNFKTLNKKKLFLVMNVYKFQLDLFYVNSSYCSMQNDMTFTFYSYRLCCVLIGQEIKITPSYLLYIPYYPAKMFYQKNK